MSPHAWKDNGIFIISFHALIIRPFAPWSCQQFALIHPLQTWSADPTAGRTCQASPSELPVYSVCVDLASWCCVGGAGMVEMARGTEWCNKLGNWLNWRMSNGYRLNYFASFFCCLVLYCLNSLYSCISLTWIAEFKFFNGRRICWETWFLMRFCWWEVCRSL